MQRQLKRAFETRLKKLEEKFFDDVRVLADDFRQVVMLPVCRKHGLTFMSGNGTFFFEHRDLPGAFITSNTTYSPEMDGPKAYALCKRAGLTSILELLDAEVTHNQCFGYFVRGITEEDIS